MKFGEDIGQHYTDYRFNVYESGVLHKDIAYKEIFDGFTKNGAVNLALLKNTSELLKFRCFQHMNRVQERATITAFSVGGTNVMLELVNEVKDAV